MNLFILKLKDKLIDVCEQHKIRLTPKEYDQLIQDYFDKFVDNVSIPDVMEIAENIKRRNS